MSAFKTRKEYTDWALDLLDKYGVQQPDTYSADEIKQYCPDIPESFIDQHVATRDTNRKK